MTLQVQDLTVTFGNKTVLHQFGFTLEQGETCRPAPLARSVYG